jgi:hypothetical protein
MTTETPRTDAFHHPTIARTLEETKSFARQLERELNESKLKYSRLHSQVSGYLSGKEWDHWQKYNESKYKP